MNRSSEPKNALCRGLLAEAHDTENASVTGMNVDEVAAKALATVRRQLAIYQVGLFGISGKDNAAIEAAGWSFSTIWRWGSARRFR